MVKDDREIYYKVKGKGNMTSVSLIILKILIANKVIIHIYSLCSMLFDLLR